jgi:hypothetical protein
MTNKHIQKSGAKADQWVNCPAEVSCRNGGAHISEGELKAVQSWKEKGNGGKFIPLKKLTLDDYKQYTFYNANTPVEKTEKNNKTTEAPIQKTHTYSPQSKAAHLLAFSAVTEYVNSPSRDSAKMLEIKEDKMKIALGLAGMDPKWATMASNSRKTSKSAVRDISLVFADYRKDVNNNLPLGTTHKQKREQTQATISKSREAQDAALRALQTNRDERLQQARKPNKQIYTADQIEKHSTAINEVKEYVSLPSTTRSSDVSLKEISMRRSLRAAGMDLNLADLAKDTRAGSELHEERLMLTFSRYRTDVKNQLPLGTTNNQKIQETRDNLEKKRKERATEMKTKQESSQAEAKKEADRVDMRSFFGRAVDNIFGKNRDF